MLVPHRATLERENQARQSHAWAVQVVAKRFEEGLAKVLDDVFVDQRFGRFLQRADPVYVTLLEGMGDAKAARGLVGNWMVAHTLATQTRFWLEDAIVDILLQRPAIGAADVRPEVYSLRMLADGWHESGKSLWDVGERWREELHGRGAWRPCIQERALDEIERIVGKEERTFEATPSREAARRGSAWGISEYEDDRSLTRAAEALGGAPVPIAVRCNLLVMEPDRPGREPHSWAIRYINPSTFGTAAQVKAERVNLLRLRAWLAQEKPFRAPAHLVVAIADLVPRLDREDTPGRIGAHFSERTRWDAEKFWEFLRVPFAAVTAGIRDAGATMRARLARALAIQS